MSTGNIPGGKSSATGIAMETASNVSLHYELFTNHKKQFKEAKTLY